MPLLFRNVRGSKRKAAIQDLEAITRKEINKDLDAQVKPALIKSHEIQVKDWKNKPEFNIRKTIKPNKIFMTVFPTGPNKKIWIWVDKGTEAHDIPAVTGKLMVFKAGGVYNPKTLPRPARTVPGGGNVTGGTKVITMKRKAFKHPGSEARNFTKQIAEDIKPDFKRVIENAFRRTSNAIKE